jgi:hypothetical protein
LIQIDVLGPVYPLTSGIDPGIGAYCADYGCGVDLDFAGSLNNLLERRSDISLTFRKKPVGMSMTVNAGAVC